MDDIKHLIELAQTEDNFTDCLFDQFLLENGFDESDISKRVYYDDLFVFYSYWHFLKFKKIPHRKRFTVGSKVGQLYRTRMTNPTGKGLKWGLKCSTKFRIAYLMFKKDSKQWQEKVKRVLAGRKGLKSKQQRQKEDEMLERILKMQHSSPDSSQK